ncbi:hypothetical protein ACHAXT_000673 [Thalassiosira profunda]
MSVQERIRALNLHNEGVSGRDGAPAEAKLAAKPAPTSPSSPKAQLFKAAKVIRNSFDAEGDLLSSARSGTSFASDRTEELPPSSPTKSDGPLREVDDGSQGSEEIDAVSALNFWKTKGVDALRPRSYKEAKDAKPRVHPETGAGAENVDAEVPADEVGSPPLGTLDEYLEASNEDSATDQVPPDEMVTKTSASGLPYQAYARRSRRRSPRGAVGSPESDVDGAQSVVSSMSAMSVSSQSSLSSRAARFLKDKKDRRKGMGLGSSPTAAAGAPIMEAALQEKAAKARKKQNGEAAELGEEAATAASGPVSVPTPNHHAISELNGDGGDSHRQQDNDYSESSGPATDHETASMTMTATTASHSQYNMPPSAGRGKDIRTGRAENESSRGSVQTESMDGSSYSGLKAKDLFQNGKPQAAAASSPPAQSKNDGGNTGNDILESGCQVLGALQEAFNAVSETATSTIFGSSPGPATSSALRNDVPFDEDVAIEVEYMAEEDQAEAGSVSVNEETGSVSISTKDDSVY